MFFLILSIAMPKAFDAPEATVLAFLNSTQTVFEQAETLTASPAQLLVPSVRF
jgi:hypothetical protein